MKLSGTVIEGIQVGTKFGIATANLALKKTVDLKEGVYLVDIKIGEKNYHGLLHYGHRQTFGGEFSVEVHILDFTDDIYGETVQVETLEYLRATKKFQNGDALFTQIATDVTKARKYFLRQKIYAQWQTLSKSEKETLASKALTAVQNHPEFQNQNDILVFAPTKNEIPLVENLCKNNSNKNYYFPRIESGGMNFYLSKYEDLTPGKFGILEPKKSADFFKPSEKFFILVPAVGASLPGQRLGRGGGYYDRWLANNRSQSYSLTVLPEFAKCLDLLAEDHDQTVDEVIFV